MVQIIMVNEITSCCEEEEIRKNAERLEVEHLEREMDVTLQKMLTDDLEITAETDNLREAIEDEASLMVQYTDQLRVLDETLAAKLNDMDQAEYQLQRAKSDYAKKQKSLESLLQKRLKEQESDEIYALMREEKILRSLLAEKGLTPYTEIGDEEQSLQYGITLADRI